MIPTNNDLATASQNVIYATDGVQSAKTDDEKAKAEEALRLAKIEEQKLIANRDRVDSAVGYAEQPLNRVGGGVLGTLIAGGLGYLGLKSRKKRKENEEELSIKEKGLQSVVLGINNFTGLDFSGIFSSNDPKEVVIAQLKQKLMDELIKSQELFGTRDTVRKTIKKVKDEDTKI